MTGDELTGEALDRAVAEALGYVFAETPLTPGVDPDGEGICREQSTRWYRVPGRATWGCAQCYSVPEAYSTEWAHGGPLIERFGICLGKRYHGAKGWMARSADGPASYSDGDTPLQAAMRCIVDLHSAGAPR